MSDIALVTKIAKARTIITLFGYQWTHGELENYYNSLMKILPDIETINYNHNASSAITNCNGEPDKIITLLQATCTGIRAGIMDFIELQNKSQKEE